jgi:two-component system OmpR family sensor kinase
VKANPPLWHHRLGVRFAVILSVTLVAFGLLRRPLYDLVLDVVGLGDIDTTSYAVVDVVLSLLIAVGLATVLAVVLSRWLLGRLSRLSRALAEPPSNDELPGPFDDSGSDEISLIGEGMNALRKQVAERRREFTLADIRRREWIAQVSHDLRTPLTAQLACLDRAEMILHRPDAQRRLAELSELMAVAKADVDRVHTLADDLLEIARLDAGDRLNLEPVPPGELVRQAVRRLEPLAAQRGLRLGVLVTSSLPVLLADGRRLNRAIENLLRNAIQHAKSNVEVSAVLSNDNVRFEVRDDGRGLPKEQDFLDYLRRKSSEVRLAELAKRRSRGDGAGLGLFVAQRVAEAHRGVVDAYNLSQGGAAFCLDIPIPTEATAPVEEPPTETGGEPDPA